jgi:tetratricopeptide (TPR) repeat protein
LSDYLKVIEIEPLTSEAYNNIANLYNDELKNNEKALEFYNKSIELFPKDAMVYNNRAIFYQFTFKDNEKALLDYNKAIEDFNLRVKRFPSVILARIFGYNEKPYYKADEGSEKAPEIKFDIK